MPGLLKVLPVLMPRTKLRGILFVASFYSYGERFGFFHRTDKSIGSSGVKAHGVVDALDGFRLERTAHAWKIKSFRVIKTAS